MNKFADYIIRKRYILGLTISDAAKMIGITPVHLLNLEEGKSKPNGRTFGKICKAYNLDAEEAYEYL